MCGFLTVVTGRGAGVDCVVEVEVGAVTDAGIGPVVVPVGLASSLGVLIVALGEESYVLRSVSVPFDDEGDDDEPGVEC